ncbi:MAG: hypothetical protein PVG65_07015 [Candidatus Thorarchaeota archaeon]|jgi:hypothetical protein
MDLKKLYKYLYVLEKTQPEIKEISENFVNTVTEDLDTFKEMILYVGVLDRGTKEFTYFNELHKYIMDKLSYQKYKDFTNELINKPELFGDMAKKTTKILQKRIEYGLDNPH